MIKGIYLKNSPKMSKVGLADVLAELNPLDNEIPENRGYYDSENYSMCRREFHSKKLCIVTYTSGSDSSGISGMFQIFSMMSDACPDLFKVWKYTDSCLVTAWNRYNDLEENGLVRSFLDELTRVSAWCLKENISADREDIVQMINDYYKLVVSTPEDRDDE